MNTRSGSLRAFSPIRVRSVPIGSHSLHSANVSPSRSISRGNLRSAVISRFTAKPLRSYRFPSLASAPFGLLLLRWQTILGYYPSRSGMFHQEPSGLSDARLVTSMPIRMMHIKYSNLLLLLIFCGQYLFEVCVF